MSAITIRIPKSLQVEHDAIHSTLVEATKAPGGVGAAAKELAEVLHPHFVREEEIALPPIGLIAALAAGAQLPESVLGEALAMTDSLKAELPRMIEEHKQIRAAVEKLRNAAHAEHSEKYEQLAADLALHAQSEEEVFYPAALLVGEIIRARQQIK
jgi:iron-sulfur cluster repair protein YtfE (RIC family)